MKLFPNIILKYAISKDGFIGKENESVWLTNHYSKRLVHKWRSEVDGVLVGTGTAEVDNPSLNTRYGFQGHPKRIVLDKKLRLSDNLKVFNRKSSTIVLHQSQNPVQGKLKLKYIYADNWELENLLMILKRNGINNLIIEGGRKILEIFILKSLWNEARIFTSPIYLKEGIPAPIIAESPIESYKIDSDMLEIFRNNN